VPRRGNPTVAVGETHGKGHITDPKDPGGVRIFAPGIVACLVDPSGVGDSEL